MMSRGLLLMLGVGGLEVVHPVQRGVPVQAASTLDWQWICASLLQWRIAKGVW